LVTISLHSETNILESKLMLHEPYCIRNVKKCTCGMIINIEDEVDHNNEFHIDVKCPYCSRKYPKSDILYHQENCHERKSECRYCTLQVTVGEKEEHEYICGAKTDKCDKCNKYIPIKDFDTHHCDEEIYLNKHIDVDNIPVVFKKTKKVINPGEIATMNKVGILHNKKEPSIYPINPPVVHPPIIHHKREIETNKVQNLKVDNSNSHKEKINEKLIQNVKVDIGNSHKEKINEKLIKVEIGNSHKEKINDKLNRIEISNKRENEDKKNHIINDKFIKEKHPPIKPVEKKVPNSNNKIDDILKAGLKHKENIEKKPTIIAKPITTNKPIDLNKKLTSSPGKLNKEPIIKKMPYKKELPKETFKPKLASNNKSQNPKHT
jgi:hypothetical protein